MRLGYACINMSLGNGVTTNRGMTKRTFESAGIQRVSSLALMNVNDLLSILKWNVSKGIRFFRMSSDIVPWGDNLDLKSLPDYSAIASTLAEVGKYVADNNVRLTFHPGPFVVLCSPNEEVVRKSVRNLELHGEIMDMIGLSQTPYNKINIHCNGTYGDKDSAMARFCRNFGLLSDSVKTRLTVENDDKASMYSVMDLINIHLEIGIPIVFDFHHHGFNDGGATMEDALNLACTTWPVGITPAVHYAESRPGNNPRAHADLIKSLPNLYGNDLDIMVEAKSKDLAILPFLKQQNNNTLNEGSL